MIMTHLKINFMSYDSTGEYEDTHNYEAPNNSKT
jgi:GH18 family chitinase